MIPQEELDRALARWKARIQGHELPVPVAVPAATAHPPTRAASPARMATPPPADASEATQVVAHPYQGGESGNVVAEVNLDDGDYDDYTNREANPGR